jgi:beta-galactosidase
MWGLFSLVWQRGDDVVPYVEELNTLAHKLDASRLTVGCSNVDGDINFVTDLVVLRQDVGWMKGSYEDVSVWCKQLARNKAFSELRSGVCYGEAGVRGHNAEHIERATRTSRLYPERRQREMHERYIDIIETNECFWGVWLDNMFDYASWRSAYGMNLAGMVEHDHKTTKDVYHLYRARWNGDASTMHIADRGWRERRDTLQRITVYSSVGAPRLVVGADTIATSERSRGCYVADSVVVKGVQVIRAVDASARCRDSIMLRVGSSR